MSLSPDQKEYRLQCAVVKHLDSAFKESRLEYTAIPNRPGDAKDGWFKKQMGTKAGAADILLGWPDGRCGYIELKAPDGKLKTKQNKFLSRWAAIGWRTAVCNSVRGVHHTLTLWGLKASHTNILEPDYSTKDEKFKQAFEIYKP